MLFEDSLRIHSEKLPWIHFQILLEVSFLDFPRKLCINFLCISFTLFFFLNLDIREKIQTLFNLYKFSPTNFSRVFGKNSYSFFLSKILLLFEKIKKKKQNFFINFSWMIYSEYRTSIPFKIAPKSYSKILTGFFQENYPRISQEIPLGTFSDYLPRIPWEFLVGFFSKTPSEISSRIH